MDFVACKRSGTTVAGSQHRSVGLPFRNDGGKPHTHTLDGDKRSRGAARGRSFWRFGRWAARVPGRTTAPTRASRRWIGGFHAVRPGLRIMLCMRGEIARRRSVDHARSRSRRRQACAPGNARWPTTWSRLWAACECGGRTVRVLFWATPTLLAGKESRAGRVGHACSIPRLHSLHTMVHAPCFSRSHRIDQLKCSISHDTM